MSSPYFQDKAIYFIGGGDGRITENATKVEEGLPLPTFSRIMESIGKLSIVQKALS